MSGLLSRFKWKKGAAAPADEKKAADPPKPAEAPKPADPPKSAEPPKPAEPPKAAEPPKPAQPEKKPKPKRQPNPLVVAARHAVLDALHPVVWPALLPLALVAGLAWLLGYLFWSPTVIAAHELLDQGAGMITWLTNAEAVNVEDLHSVVGPIALGVLVTVLMPWLQMLLLLLVSRYTVGRIVGFLALRRFVGLDRLHGEAGLKGLMRSFAEVTKLVGLLLASLPLWLLPPFGLLLPQLACGWLTDRLLSSDVLADHASADERQQLLQAHRWPLLGMGLVCTQLGTGPTLLWLFALVSPVFTPGAVLLFSALHALVWAFTVLWFAHYLLAALGGVRAVKAAEKAKVAAAEAAEKEKAAAAAAAEKEKAAAADAAAKRAIQEAALAAAQAVMAAAHAATPSPPPPPKT